MKPEDLDKNQPLSVNTSDDEEREVKRLIRAFRGGDQVAYSRIVNRYRRQVTALAYRMVRDYDEAADVAQEVFVKMARHLDRYDEKRKFYTWLYRITINASIDYARRNQRHQHEPLDTAPDIQSDAEGAPDMSYFRSRLSEHIVEATATLNEKQRSAFMLRDIGGRKVNDVAGIMEMPEATVRWYLHRARLRIRKELLRRCPHLLILLGIR